MQGPVAVNVEQGLHGLHELGRAVPVRRPGVDPKHHDSWVGASCCECEVHEQGVAARNLALRDRADSDAQGSQRHVEGVREARRRRAFGFGRGLAVIDKQSLDGVPLFGTKRHQAGGIHAATQQDDVTSRPRPSGTHDCLA